MRYGFACSVIVALLIASPASSEIDLIIAASAFESTPTKVSIVGTFNAWKTEATPIRLVGTSWSALLSLPNGRHYYKLVWQDRAGQTHWMHDPVNPFIADNGEGGSNNFIDVVGGKLTERLEGLEQFEWPPAKERKVPATDGSRTWEVLRTRVDHPEFTKRYQPKKGVAVAGDFNDWRLGQFPLARCRDGAWRAYIPIRRPFSYKIIVDGIWHMDPGNDPPGTLLLLPSQAPRELPAKSIHRIPDGLGRFNSYREQADATSPALVTMDVSVQAGSARELDVVTSYIASDDYGRAVVMARKVQEANKSGGDSNTLIGLQALALEAKAHKRWASLDSAAKCWAEMLAANRDTGVTREAAVELAAYYIFVSRDFEGARRVCEWALRQGVQGAEGLAIFRRYVSCTLRERRYEETLETVATALAGLPVPDGNDRMYAADYTELYLAQGICHFYLKQWEPAREAFQQVVEIHPWADSQNVQRARQWLESVEARKIVHPYDPY